MSNNLIDVSVIVAAYNESAIIMENLGRIVYELNTRPFVQWELICIDDGSDDNTGLLMEDFKSSYPNITVIHQRRNYGQGRALRSGFDISRGQIVVTLDADLSYKPEYVYRLMDAVDEINVDIVLTSPYMKLGVVKNVPFFRHLLSRFANYYLARITGQHIFTSTSVVRAYRREVLDSLILTSDGIDLLLEVLVKASLMGFRISEIPAQLEWSIKKTSKNKTQRVSKMRILNTIYTDLFIGWLYRPAGVFLVLSWLLIIPGVYMAITLVISMLDIWTENQVYGFSQSLTITLSEVVLNHIQNIVFSAIFLGFGILIFAFSLTFLQNKKYYDELSRMIQISGKRLSRNPHEKNDQA